MLATHRYRVEEFMSRERITCLAATPIAALKCQLLDRDVSALIVLNDQGCAIGLVSRLDVMLAQSGEPEPQDGRRVAADIMSTELLTCFPETPILEAVTTMYRRRVDSLLVVQTDERERRPFGVIAMRDIVRGLAAGMPVC